MNRKLIALLTDFGDQDPYVGIMKAVIAQIAPGTETIDLTHLVPAGDVQKGAFTLWQAARDFPQGTVFLAVVDPGVGTERKGLCLECGGKTFIGPDNGLFSYLVWNQEYAAWELEDPHYQLPKPGSTFHGRDIFAPAAAHAASGVPGARFGPRLPAIQQLPVPKLQVQPDRMLGEILSADRFGNLFTSIGCFSREGGGLHFLSWIDSRSLRFKPRTELTIAVQDLRLPFINTFAEAEKGSLAGLIGSTGLLEIVANLGSARLILNIEPAAPVALIWQELSGPTAGG